MEITTYLENSNVEHESLEKLEGGTGNFVWRMTDRSGKTSIIKHAEPYVASSGGAIPFPLDRMDFENAALTTIPSLISQDTSIDVPEVYRYDTARHVLTISDRGSRTLKAAYTDPSLDVPRIGTQLGRWLANLHSQTKSASIGDNVTAKSIYRYPYNNLGSALQKHNHDPSLGAQINAQYGSLFQTDDECICHGDFWPGNILINSNPLKTPQTQTPTLTVIDWEMCRRGCGATDLGQFAAEAYLLDRFRGGRDLLGAFLRGYAEGSGKLEGRFLQRLGVHMGVHLAFWPTRVRWGGEEETGDVVGVGRELMGWAYEGVEGWVEGSILGELV